MAEKKLIIFDLDGTLAPSKSQIDSEMLGLLEDLLTIKEVAVISGGAYSQFEKQIIKTMNCPPESLKKLYLFPTCSTSFYRYTTKWVNVYKERLLQEEKEKIFLAFEKVLKETSFKLPETPYGEILEDRKTQITFSALGQKAPSELKKTWDTDCKKRQELKRHLERYLPEFEINIGGTTSLDITRKGIDKAYGIRQMEKHLGIKKEDMLYIGDALFEGGNDYAVKQAGVDCIETSGPEETKKIILKLIKP